MFLRFCASLTEGAVILMYSQPASIIRMDCSTVPSVSMVSVVVIDCSLIGLSPPQPISPIFTAMVFLLLYAVSESQYENAGTIRLLDIYCGLFVQTVKLRKMLY